MFQPQNCVLTIGRHWTPPPGSCVLCVWQPEPLPFEYFQRHENIQRSELYLQSFFNYAINVILAGFTLRPLYSRERTHWISVCMSLDDVASCGLYFSSVSTFWHVFYYQLKCWMCLQNLPRFLYQFRRSTMESKSSGCGFLFKDKSFTTGL